MTPHPMIMDVLWNDRDRQVLAAVTRQQLVDGTVKAPVPESARQQHPVRRTFALLLLGLRLPKGNITRAQSC
jgi:hypothetical protein